MSSEKVVMLVEDNEDHAFLIQQAITENKINHSLVWHRTGEDAIKFLDNINPDTTDETYPDIILLDLKLPGMSGFDVLSEIKHRKEFSNITVIILTSSKKDLETHRRMDLKADDYIIKPLEYSYLVKELSNITKF